MARRFDTSASNYMTLGNNAIGALVDGASKISVHCRSKAASLTTGAFDNCLLFGQISVNRSAVRMGVRGDLGTKVLTVGGRSVTTDSYQSGDATSAFTLDAWHGCGGTLDIGSDTITPYFNGVAEGGGAVTFGNTVFTNLPYTQPDEIGSADLTTSKFDGDIAEFGLWTFDSGTASLTASEFLALSKGFSPRFIRPQNLVFYMPLIGANSPERDIRAGLTGTITGTIAQSAHPAVYYPRRAQRSVSQGGLSAGFFGAPMPYHRTVLIND